jgi:hypothetical protein
MTTNLVNTYRVIGQPRVADNITFSSLVENKIFVQKK